MRSLVLMACRSPVLSAFSDVVERPVMALLESTLIWAVLMLAPRAATCVEVKRLTTLVLNPASCTVLTPVAAVMAAAVRPVTWETPSSPICEVVSLEARAVTSFVVRALTWDEVSSWTCEVARPPICGVVRCARSLVLMACSAPVLSALSAAVLICTMSAAEKYGICVVCRPAA